MFEITCDSSMGLKTLKLTPDHYVYFRINGQEGISHLTSQHLTIGDELILVDNYSVGYTTVEFAKIVDIKQH